MIPDFALRNTTMKTSYTPVLNYRNGPQRTATDRNGHQNGHGNLKKKSRILTKSVAIGEIPLLPY